MKRILITGTAGNIGTEVVHYLCELDNNWNKFQDWTIIGTSFSFLYVQNMIYLYVGG